MYRDSLVVRESAIRVPDRGGLASVGSERRIPGPGKRLEDCEGTGPARSTQSSDPWIWGGCIAIRQNPYRFGDRGVVGFLTESEQVPHIVPKNKSGEVQTRLYIFGLEN